LWAFGGKKQNQMEQQLKFLQDRIEALQRHNQKKMDQAMKIIKYYKNKNTSK